MEAHTFVLMGRPGSGKDTQGHLLAEKLGARLFSSGERFRALAAGDTVLGKRLKSDLDAGLLMPIWLACYMYEQALFALKAEDSIIFQGACRILPEAQLFDEVNTWLGRAYSVIYLDISEEEMRSRLSGRRGGGRADDAEAAIQTRISEYNTKTMLSIDFFKSKGTLISINGAQPREAVHADILGALGVA